MSACDMGLILDNMDCLTYSSRQEVDRYCYEYGRRAYEAVVHKGLSSAKVIRKWIPESRRSPTNKTLTSSDRGRGGGYGFATRTRVVSSFQSQQS